jgi:hypothetical protein
VIAVLRTRLGVAWLLLVAATVVSLVLGSSHGVEGGAVELATALVLVVGFVKARYVGLEFMELRHAARPLRLAFEAWVLGVGAIVVATYLLA